MSRPQFDLRDLDPTLSGNPRTVDFMRSRAGSRAAWEEGGLAAGEMQVWQYVRPEGDLAHFLENPREPGKQKKVASTFPGTFTPGQNVQVGISRQGVVILGHPPGPAREISQNVKRERSGTLDLLGIETADPYEIANDGAVVTVTFTGFGFNESPVDTLTAMHHDPDDAAADSEGFAPLAGVTIGTVTWTSATEIQADVTVATTVAGGTLIAFEITRS